MPFTPGAAKTVDQVTAKYVTKTGAAGADWVAGVLAPKRPAWEGALASVAKWKAQLNAAMAAGSYEAGINRFKANADLTANEIQADGGSSYANGTSKKSYKFKAAMTGLLPQIQSNAAKVRAMPNATLADRINRATTMITLNAGLRGKYRG